MPNSRFLIFLICICVHALSGIDPLSASDYHVSTDGSNDSPGSADQPWRSIQHAIDSVEPGDTVHVHNGTYREQIGFSVSGTKDDGPITLRNFEKEKVVIDGTGLNCDSPLIEISGKNHLTIDGFELCNFKSKQPNQTPIGIYVSGSSRGVTIANCIIHDLGSEAPVNNKRLGRDAHGIAVYGDSEQAISKLKILGNELYDLKLGSSEALVVNGNVDGFEILDNVVHDCDNIGIDCIGFESVSPNGKTDQARNGIVSGNHVYNIATAANPAYPGDSSAAGIYVDGGTEIVLERNRVHHCDFGIEVASEHKGKVTDKITVRNNILHENLQAGLIVGGYDKQSTGDAQDCIITNNTFYNNDTKPGSDEWGQIHLQFRVNDCRFSNNVLFHNIDKDGNNIFVVHWNKTGERNVFSHNQYYGPANSVWVLGDEWIDEWSVFQKHNATDESERFADPMLVSPKDNDFSLTQRSPCIDSGDTSIISENEIDYAGNARKQNEAVDRGAIESLTGK